MTKSGNEPDAKEREKHINLLTVGREAAHHGFARARTPWRLAPTEGLGEREDNSITTRLARKKEGARVIDPAPCPAPVSARAKREESIDPGGVSWARLGRMRP